MSPPLLNLELFCAGQPNKFLPTVYRYTQAMHPVMPHAQGDVLVIFFPEPIYYTPEKVNFNVEPSIFRDLPGKTLFSTRSMD